MNKLLIGGLATAALVLAGCTTTVEPEPIVAQTVTPEPQIVIPEPESNYSESLAPGDAMFIVMMEAVDTPSYFLEGDLLYALQEQAINTCDYINAGMSSDDITLALVLAFADSDADEEVEDAFLAATVASVYSYCPQHQGFWE